MLRGTKQIIQVLLLVTVFVIGCKPAFKTPPAHSPVALIEPEKVVEKDLVPTWNPPVESDSKKAKIYEEPIVKINNPTGEIHYGRTQIENAKSTYTVQDKKMIVTGLARIFDSEKKEVAQVEFNLVGINSNDNRDIELKPMFDEVQHSSIKPIIAAIAHCTGINAEGETNCDSVTIDFFLRYKGVNLTHQMRIAEAGELKPTQKQVEPKAAVEKVEVEEIIDLKTVDKSTGIEADLDKAPQEGVEDAIAGPNEVQAQEVKLDKIFSNDLDAKDVPAVKFPTAKQDPKKPVETTSPTKPTQTTPRKPVTPAKPGPPPRSENAPPKEEDKTEIILPNSFKKMMDGNIRPFNQAIHYADGGHLLNATSLLVKQQNLDKKAFFEIARPENQSHYGTYEMAEMLIRMGDHMNEHFGDKIYISSISQKNGGRFSIHFSHQNGTDADIGYPTNIEGVKFPLVVTTEHIAATKTSSSKAVSHFYPNHYSPEKTFDLLKFAFKQGDIEVERIFMDRMIKRDLCAYAIKKGEFKNADKDFVQKMFEKIEHVDGHGNHFHLRVKCSAEDKVCLPKLYRKNDGCGNVN
jgi:murein endopeptidase